MGSSRDQQKEAKYIGISFMVVGGIILNLLIVKKEFDLFKIAIITFFIIFGFLLFKFRNKIEDFRQSYIRSKV